MKIAFIGCVAFSRKMLHHLLTASTAEIVGVVTRTSSHFNADFVSLQPLAIERGIPCFIAEGNNQAEMAAWLSAFRPDVIYCLGWSYLLKAEILAIPKLGVVGYHPAALPKNRGRHPIVWSLVLGLDETASTFFFMDENADSGDIISQQFLPIGPADDAGVLYEKLAEIAVMQLSDITAQLSAGIYPRIPQNHNLANYWRKRTGKDGQIDWRMSADAVFNLVRALTAPYIGASCEYKGEEIKVWKTELVTTSNKGIENIEPGKILSVDGRNITVKCGTGIVTITKHEFEQIPQPEEYL